MPNRHGWNTFENYVQVHEDYLANQSSIVSHTLRFRPVAKRGRIVSVELSGQIFCGRQVVVDVTKLLEARYTERGVLQVRGLRYSYNAHARGRFNLLRYDNGHDDPNEYHRHRFDPFTGEQVEFQYVTRQQFPTLSELLDEVEVLSAKLGLLT
ncbi:MAG: toxin-antitoxin system TumE family protein [Chloroflexota bacterium]